MNTARRDDVEQRNTRRVGTCCPIVELRQYTLHPGQRDVLVELFDREFVDSQEAVGMTVIGQFRDLDDPDRFVWLRGFTDMATRARALEAFYGGPVWARHSKSANATMIDSDNVLLLRPAGPDSGFSSETRRPDRQSAEIPSDLVVATIYYPSAEHVHKFADFFASSIEPTVNGTDAAIIAVLVTESAPNNFPGLPVREGEHVLVAVTAFADEQEYQRHVETYAVASRLQGLDAEIERRVDRIETLRLRATAGSRCRGARVPRTSSVASVAHP